MKLYQYIFDKTDSRFIVNELDADYCKSILQPYYAFLLKNGSTNILFEYSLNTVSPSMRYKTPATLQYYSLKKDDKAAIDAFKERLLSEESELYEEYDKKRKKLKEWVSALEKEEAYGHLIGMRVRTPLGKEGTVVDFLTKEETVQCNMMGQCIYVELDDGTVEDWCYGLEPVDKLNEKEEKEI